MASTIAFLATPEALYFSKADAPVGGRPSSAVTQLIQGIYETYPSQARAIVRHRIYTNRPPTEMCSGMVKVAARAITQLGTEPELSDLRGHPELPEDFSSLPQIEVRFEDDHRPENERRTSPLHAAQTHEDYLRLALQLAGEIPREAPRYRCDRPIAALMVSGEGEVIDWALNKTSRNKTCHAEVNLLQAHWRRTRSPVPRGTRIYTTLKPCKMCAGMIWHSAEDFRDIQVFYAEPDLGRGSKYTVLDPGTHERKRACADPEHWRLELSQWVRINSDGSNSRADLTPSLRGSDPCPSEQSP